MKCVKRDLGEENMLCHIFLLPVMWRPALQNPRVGLCSGNCHLWASAKLKHAGWVRTREAVVASLQDLRL